MTLWTLNSAVAWIQDKEAEAHAAGYNPLLGGSVLYKGESDKDLDIVAIPQSYQPQNREDLLRLFGKAFAVKNHPGLTVYKFANPRIDLIVPWVDKVE